ncbi:MAG TPA: hypothetical protein VMT85_15355 [Thermoanaerobaculia bacterium]|nr:hypothetical protein [Thermoanaerobaculia bacterium]
MSERRNRRGLLPETDAGLPARRPHRIAALLLVVLACTGLRLVHLEADTPIGVGTGSMGLYIDEGYKTLDARNTVLFGTQRWHPQDRYHGWRGASPLTHWPFVASFRILGVELGSARLVSILYFLLFLLLYAFVGARERPMAHRLAGLLLLTVSYVLFFFSRVALIEVAITTASYGALFLLRSPRMRRPELAFLLVCVLAAVATFDIKRSALLYFVPIVTGLVVAAALDDRWAGLARRWAPAAFAFLLLVAYLARAAWTWRIELAPAASFRKLFLNPMTTSRTPDAEASVLLVCLGLLCALHLLALRPREVLSDPYRCALLAMALLAPALLALFAYTPLRYYVPILPAYVLLFLEWWWLEPWTWTRRSDSLLAHALGLPLLVAWIFLAGLAFDELVLYQLPLRLGDTPGISVTVFYRIFLPVATVAALALWPVRERFFASRLAPAAVALLLVLTVARDLWMVGRFLGAPSYESREIGRSLEEIVGTSASIGGDIAPFFALGTRMRALVVAPHSNSLEENPELEFDFFQFSETNEGRATRQILEERSGVTIGPALYESEYAGRAISLHRVRWDEPRDDSHESRDEPRDQESRDG